MNRILQSRLFIITLILYVTYNSGFMLSTTNSIGIILDMFFAMIFLIPVMYNLFNVRLRFVQYSLILTIVFTLITFIIYRFNPVGAYFGIIFKSIVAMGIVLTYNFRSVVYFFKKYLSVIAIVSLIGHYFIVTNIIPVDMKIIYNINEVPYNVSFPFFSLVWLPEKNIGIFWEPGLFASFLILGLVLEISFKSNEKISYFRIFLFIFTIFTTKSSAGYGLLLFVLLLYLIEIVNSTKKKYKYIIYLFLVFPVILIIIFYPLFFNILNFEQIDILSKLMPEELINQSRYLSIKHNISVFLTMPIFGVGFSNASNLMRHVADTSSTTFLISVFGVPGSLYTIMWIYGIIKNPLLKKNISIIIFLIILLIINKEPHYIILFTWILLYYFIYISSIDYTVEVQDANA